MAIAPHEVRVLKMLVDGHNYKTAAVELSVSVNTISFDIRHIYEKLHVHTRSEAVAKALRNQNRRVTVRSLILLSERSYLRRW